MAVPPPLATQDVRFYATTNQGANWSDDVPVMEVRFDAWLEKVVAEAEAKGREKAFAEVYSTLEGQVEFIENMVEENKELDGPPIIFDDSYVSGIRHSLETVKVSRRLAELPEDLPTR